MEKNLLKTYAAWLLNDKWSIVNRSLEKMTCRMLFVFTQPSL